MNVLDFKLSKESFPYTVLPPHRRRQPIGVSAVHDRGISRSREKHIISAVQPERKRFLILGEQTLMTNLSVFRVDEKSESRCHYEMDSAKS